MLVIEESFNGLFGDPCPDENKALRIHYAANGVRGISVSVEDTTVLIDARRYENQSIGKKKPKIAPPTNKKCSAAAQVLGTTDLVCLICGYLNVFPDRLNSMAISRVWRDVIHENGLTDSFVVGVRSYAARPCYLDMPPSFFKLVLSKSRGQLIHLDLSYYEAATDDLVIPVLIGNPNLKNLDVSGCINLTSECLKMIGPCCSQLVALRLKRLPEVNDGCVIAIARNCTKMERLDLSDCHHITDAGIFELGEHLRHLVAFYAKDVFNVSNRSIHVLLENCGSNLQVLSLPFMFGITREGLLPLQSVGKRLASLNLWECFSIDDDAIVNTVCHCTNLVDLNLRNVHLLTDHSITQVSMRLTHLQHLDLRYLRAITDVSLEHISKNLKRLRSLNLTHCSSITQYGVASTCSSLNELTELRLANGPGYDDKTVQLIADSVNKRSGNNKSLDLLDMRGNTCLTRQALDILNFTLSRTFLESPAQVFLFDASS